MRYYFILLCICCVLNTNTSFAFAISKPAINNTELITHLNSIKASDLVRLSVKDFTSITGKKNEPVGQAFIFSFKNKNKT